MDFPEVLERHINRGTLSRINDSTYGATSAKLGISATVRLLRGRAVVEVASGAPATALVPSSLVLRAQMDKYHGAFYASATQLDDFLSEMG